MMKNCRGDAGTAATRRVRLVSQDGVGFVAVLMALLIAAALYFGYFELQRASDGRSGGITAIEGSRVFACRTNRQSVERQIAMWSVNHPQEAPSLAALEAEVGSVPSCPEGGRYSLAGRQVRCSAHP